MRLKTKELNCNCIEFNYYMDAVSADKYSTEIEVLVEAKLEDIPEQIDLFLLEQGELVNVFGHVKLWECYEVGDLVKLIFVK